MTVFSAGHDVRSVQVGRLAAVQRHLVADPELDAFLNRVCDRAAAVFDVPMATVGFVGADRVWFRGRHGVGIAEASAAPGLCATAILSPETYVLPDTMDDADASEHPLVRDEPLLRFYAAAPIVTSDGYRIGTVSVMDTAPRSTTHGELVVLRELAATVGRELEARRAAST